MPDTEQDSDADGDQQKTFMMVFLVVGVVAGGIAIYFAINSIMGKEEKIVEGPDNYKEVKLFQDPLRKTKKKRQRSTGGMPMTTWKLEPPVVQLSSDLTPEQAKKIKKEIKKREGLFRSKINEYLTQKNESFIWNKNRNDQLREFIREELENIFPNKIKRVLIPSFDPQY